MSLTKSLLLLLQSMPKQVPNHRKVLQKWPSMPFKRHASSASVFGSCKVPLQGALGGPRHYADPPPPQEQGIRPLLAREGKMTIGFCTFQKTSILTPLKLSFSLVFFITVTGAETRPDSRGLRRSADPLEVAHDFQGICFENSVFKAFQR